MPMITSCTNARARLAALYDKVSSTRTLVIIRRQGAEDVVLVDAAELRSLTETAHLLRSPKNAQRLIAALVRARGHKLPTDTVATLRRKFDPGEGS